MFFTTDLRLLKTPFTSFILSANFYQTKIEKNYCQCQLRLSSLSTNTKCSLRSLEIYQSDFLSKVTALTAYPIISRRSEDTDSLLDLCSLHVICSIAVVVKVTDFSVEN